MEIIKTEDCKPIFSWCPNVETDAMEQMKIIARLPYVNHVALMPDGHLGQNMCIGGVVACNNVIVPDFCGVDIGCGMGAIKTSLEKQQLEDKKVCKRLLHSFSSGIPVGFSHNSDKRFKELISNYKNDYESIFDKTVDKIVNKHNPISMNISQDFFSSLGTLGGGNHFCEIQYDENNNIWIMLHSGSRNIGKKVGDYFNELAAKMNARWYSESRTIPYLPVDTEEGQAYLAWMNFALEFAFLNRKVMLKEVMKSIEYEFKGDVSFITKKEFEDAIDNMINIHHNFASLENHMGKNVWVHRKGATMARDGQTGIIPGSMGTSSYIVKGKGNIHSLMSCSHGAGRKMGRRQFCREMKDKMGEIEKSLEGVIHSDFSKIEHGKDKGTIDVSEAPGAYKDIEEVINNELDLIEPIVKLRPLICLKG